MSTLRLIFLAHLVLIMLFTGGASGQSIQYEMLSEEPADWLSAYKLAYQNPQATRNDLLNWLKLSTEATNDWRLYHLFTEFGAPEDIPQLIEAYQRSTGFRKKVIEGSIRSLYRPLDNPQIAIRNITFTIDAEDDNYLPEAAQRIHISKYGLSQLNQLALSFQSSNALAALLGETWDNQDEALAEIEPLLSPEDWLAYSDNIAKVLEVIPHRILYTGIVRANITNLMQQPLLLNMWTETWGSSLPTNSPTQIVYLQPRVRGEFSQAIMLVVDSKQKYLRINIRARQVNGDWYLMPATIYFNVQGEQDIAID